MNSYTALDRQHPRDLFDVQQLFNHFRGITEEIKDGFLMTLLSHNRPINEILQPHLLDQTTSFKSQFEGMSLIPFSYEEFEACRKRLVKEINEAFTEKDKQLLLSFKAGEPDWTLSNIAKLQYLPAVKWKLQNIQKLKKQNPKQHKLLLQKLEAALHSVSKPDN
jgi:hypothetical protein